MGKHRNLKQEKILLQFMTENPGIAQGSVVIGAEKLWKQLSDKLNASGPPIKDCNSWRRVWMDWKTTIKKKLVHNRAEKASKKAEYLNIFPITANDDKVARICGFRKQELKISRRTKKNGESEKSLSPPAIVKDEIIDSKNIAFKIYALPENVQTSEIS